MLRLAANLSAVLFSPGEDATLAVTSTHEHFSVLAVHALGLSPISYPISIFEVNTMLVEDMHALLLIIWTRAVFKY